LTFQISDALRYTILLNEEEYSAGAAALIAELPAKHGVRAHKLKNYWGDGDGYQGINNVFVVPCAEAATGEPLVEIQVGAGGE